MFPKFAMLLGLGNPLAVELVGSQGIQALGSDSFPTPSRRPLDQLRSSRRSQEKNSSSRTSRGRPSSRSKVELGKDRPHQVVAEFFFCHCSLRLRNPRWGPG